MVVAEEVELRFVADIMPNKITEKHRNDQNWTRHEVEQSRVHFASHVRDSSSVRPNTDNYTI